VSSFQVFLAEGATDESHRLDRMRAGTAIYAVLLPRPPPYEVTNTLEGAHRIPKAK